MKYCPACNFSFPDFHHVCDFDGTELVTEPERQALIVHPSPLRSALKSPAFLSVLLAIVLLSSAIMIGYLETRSTHVATNERVTNAPADVSPIENGGKQAPRPSRRLARSFRNHNRNLKRLSPTMASLRQETAKSRAVTKRHQTFTGGSIANGETARSAAAQPVSVKPMTNTQARASESPARSSAPRNTEFAASRNFEPSHHQKDPKFTAMLKTTWHVLKKPFKF